MEVAWLLLQGTATHPRTHAHTYSTHLTARHPPIRTRSMTALLPQPGEESWTHEPALQSCLAQSLAKELPQQLARQSLLLHSKAPLYDPVKGGEFRSRELPGSPQGFAPVLHLFRDNSDELVYQLLSIPSAHPIPNVGPPTHLHSHSRTHTLPCRSTHCLSPPPQSTSWGSTGVPSRPATKTCSSCTGTLSPVARATKWSCCWARWTRGCSHWIAATRSACTSASLWVS